MHAPRDAKATRCMVASAHPLGSAAGVKVLKQGGNAVDAAVATALALNVVEPNASGLGGGGFMLIRMRDGRTDLIDYRDQAPYAASRSLFLKDGKVEEDWVNHGGRSVAVPGSIAGYDAALSRYGSKGWKAVVQEAIRLAREGFAVSENLANFTASHFDLLSRCESSAALYQNDGLPFEPGQRMTNPNLARTLEKIVAEGPDVFYRGDIAKAIVEAVRADNGVFTAEDLANYEAKSRTPVRGHYRGYEIISSPPPSSGGTHLIELLNVMQNFNVENMGHNSVEYIHTMAEAMKWVYADRERYMADPDFVSVPVDELIDPAYARTIAGYIRPGTSVKEVQPGRFEDPPKSGNTSHICVIDRWGNTVSLTQTINHWWGSGLAVPGCGFLLNDQMADFSMDEDSVNGVEGGKRPLSSMSPSIVLKDGRPFLIVGTPGGTRIISALAQVVMNVIDFDMGIDEAIQSPRFHCYSTGGKAASIDVESRIPETIRNGLEGLGHDVKVREAYDKYFGGAQGILIFHDSRRRLLLGGADSRRDGACAGY